MPRWRAEAFIPYHLAGKDLIPEHLEFVFTPQLSEPHCQHSERAVELAVPWLKPSPSPASNNTSWLCFPLPAHHHFLPSADVKIKQTQRQWPGQAVKTKCHRDGANERSGLWFLCRAGPSPSFPACVPCKKSRLGTRWENIWAEMALSPSTQEAQSCCQLDKALPGHF